VVAAAVSGILRPMTERKGDVLAEPDRRLVAGNWKMNGTAASARAWARAAAEAAAASAHHEVVVFPSFPLLAAASEGLLAGGGAARLGAQACHAEPSGAHTGGVAAPMLADAGCSYVLCGHSETRVEQGLSDAAVGRVAAAARRAGLRPVVCVGETDADRRAGRTREVLRRQVAAALGEARGAPGGGLDLAYEPVWAIGTGVSARPEDATEAHAWIRETAREAGFERVRILYGGSVSPANIEGLLASLEVDGVLVGGASLEPGSFAALVAAGASSAWRSR
jgi:triosephosphate isomerase